LTPLYHFSNGIKAKIQMPVSADKTFEELIELQLLGKSCQRTVKTSQGGSNENQPL
jgi:hypothetical protein